MITSYRWLPEGSGAFFQDGGSFCCLFLLSRLPQGTLAPAELKIVVALTTQMADGWVGGGQGHGLLAALCPMLSEPMRGCSSCHLLIFPQKVSGLALFNVNLIILE